MKLNKVLLLAAAVLMLGTAVAAPVNPKRAARVAQNFYASLSGAKGNTTLTATPAEWQYKGIYLFAAAEGGFVLVAADDAVRPILGYSLTGTLDPTDMPPALQQWLHAYQQEIDAVANSQFSNLKSQFPEWYALENNLMPKDGDTTGVAPLLTTYWDQTYPYNGYCPGGSATGCAATAQAQVMNFWQYPAFGMGSHSYTHASYGEQKADFGHTLYDWANMPARANYNSPMEQKEAVATLMYHCGVSLDMQYDPNGSAASGLAGIEGIPSIDNSLRGALEVAPDNAGVRLQLIQSKWKEQLFDDVISLCKPALEYNPDEMAFYYFLGLAYFQKDEKDKALHTFQLGVSQINSESNKEIVSDFYAIMGDILHEKGREQEAYVAYDSCLQWKDDNLGALNNYAYYLSEKGKDLQKAEKMSYELSHHQG